MNPAATSVPGAGLELPPSPSGAVRPVRASPARALLKALGFTQRQLAAAVAWQSSVPVAIGTIVGVPLGIVIGRLLWDLFAHQINAVPVPTVPSLPIALIVVVAVVLANIVAAIPGRMARERRRRWFSGLSDDLSYDQRKVRSWCPPRTGLSFRNEFGTQAILIFMAKGIRWSSRRKPPQGGGIQWR